MSPFPDLPHSSPSCIGDWIQEMRDSRIYWRCAGCGALCHDRPGMTEAVERESAIGVLLDRLTRAGRDLLEEDRPPEPPEG